MCGINFKLKLIFLSNHKTGSTTIENILEKYNLIDLYFRDFKNKKHLPKNIKHTTYTQLVENGSIKNIKDYEIIVFTRNPVKRMVSLYFYKSKLIIPYYTNFPNCLNETINNIIKNDDYRANRFIYDKNGNKPSNMKVFKLENLREFLNFLELKGINIKIKDIVIKNKSTYISNPILNIDVIQMIINYFKYEITYHYPELLKKNNSKTKNKIIKYKSKLLKKNKGLGK